MVSLATELVIILRKLGWIIVVDFLNNSHVTYCNVLNP